LAHFRSCKSVFETPGEKRVAWSKEEFSEIIQLLQNELSSRFNDFHSNSSENLHFQNPFEVDINDVGERKIEVTKLQANDSLKNAFLPSDLRIFYSGLPSEVFPKIRNVSARWNTTYDMPFEAEARLNSI
jgi:hypothetical protein